MKKFIETTQGYVETAQGHVKQWSTQGFSWGTLVMLSLFSWLVGFAIRTDIVREVIFRLGWIFFILGVGWAMEKAKDKGELNLFGFKVPLGPWIMSALLCAFVIDWLVPSVSVRIVLWPLFAAVFTIMPIFLKRSWNLFNPYVNLKDNKDLPSERQQTLVIVLTSILLSCWLQFYFLLQNWLTLYPSLLSDNFSNSGFVVRLLWREPPESTGARLLNAVEAVLSQELSPTPWSQVEQWLVNLDQQVPVLKDRAEGLLGETGQTERQLWSLQAQIIPGAPDYTVRFRAYWQGPSSRPRGYYLERYCLIAQSPISQITGADSLAITPTRVECQPISPKQWVLPDRRTLNN